LEDIQRFVDEKREEDLHLEFKQKKDSRNGAPDPEDKEKFSKCLSVFANFDGGVLIWGVKTDHRDQHMASDNKYYRRTSNASRQMEHYELEDMFGRRQRPGLKLRLALLFKIPWE
jgi:hypothetical protein